MVAGSQVGKVQEKPEVRALAWKYSVEDLTRSAATIARMLLEEGELAMPSSKSVDDALQTAALRERAGGAAVPIRAALELCGR